jgi:glycosyltransferase involved in cell wall biosynthesis
MTLSPPSRFFPPVEMADSIVTLLRDAELRRSVGAAARQFVEDHWSWEAHFERLEGWLEESAEIHREAS